MTDHCFISYSTADALDFARKLANKLEGGNIPIWFDKDDLKPSMDWDIQIDHALKTCRMVLFVMTADSTHEKSVCRQEWSRALSFKKPIVPLWVQNEVDVPFRLQDRQRIDFRKSFNAGLANLRDYLEWLDSPEGVLQTYNDRLLDAQRDLQRARDEDKPRIQLDIEELTKQIEAQEKVVANPTAAKEQTEKNIKAGIEREQQPERLVAIKAPTKFINPPPGIAPIYFQDRNFETEQIAGFLKNDAQRLMTIVGRAGIGKTATICRLLKGLERGVLPDNLGEMKVDGIVYLSEAGSHKINFANIFYDLCKLLSVETAQKLDAIYKNPQTSTESKIQCLLDNFQGERVVLLLDNLEPLVNEDLASLPLHDTELSEALYAFLNGTYTAVKVIITTRIPPLQLNGIQPGRQRIYHLEDGLEPKYAEQMLREMDADGILGLKNADGKLLNGAYERTRGFPKALEALFQILASDRYTTLEELLDMPTPENVVEALVGEAFNRLDTNAQKVMQALAVYNLPVTPAAVDFVLAPHIPAIDSALILQRLANMHFARKESGRFYLHPVDREFAFELIPLEDLTTNKGTTLALGASVGDVAKKEERDLIDKTSKSTKEDLELLLESLRSSRFNKFTKHHLTLRAADYFRQARKPRTEWKKLEDLTAQLAEFDLRCAAGDYDTAASVLFEIDYDYLLLWGHYRLTIELHEKLQGKLTSPEVRSISSANLGVAYYYIGQVRVAIEFYEEVLELAREDKNKQHEGAILSRLGLAYANLGDALKAIEYQGQALIIAREIGDRRGEGVNLGGLGNRYADLGDALKAIEYQEQALVIAREIGDRRGERSYLGNLGNHYADLGNALKAIEFYEQSLIIAREIGSKQGEGIILSNLASRYSELGEDDKAIDYYNQAIQNAREIGDKYGECKRLNGLAEVLIEKGDLQSAIKNAAESLQIGQEMSNPEVCIESSRTLAIAFLFSEKLREALQVVQEASKYYRPSFIFNISALHGIIALRQGERKTAQEAFTKSIAQAGEILAKTPEYYDALDAKGLALCGLILAGRSDPSMPRDVNAGKTVPPDKAMVNTGWVAPTINDAIETFRAARKIAPHAGVVKRVLRLFDELVKCDEEGILKDVRKVVEGK